MQAFVSRRPVTFFILFAVFFPLRPFCQGLSIRQLVDTLASPAMQGRGYVGGGLGKAADFIENQWKQAGLVPVGKSFRQPFRHPVVVFDGEALLSLNGKSLAAGSQFLVLPSSAGVKAEGRLTPLDSIRWMDAANRVVIEKVKKLTWSVSTQQDDYTVLQVPENELSGTPVTYSTAIDARKIKNFTSENLVGMVRGTERPDSFLVISAHYDHLGQLGKNAVFCGANDNASGVALMLHLAGIMAKQPPRYSVVFIAFAGEEAGLLGSAHFVKNPLIPLGNIRFLVNLDLLGTGDEGIMVVNATEFPNEWKMLDDINRNNGWLIKIGQRGKAANSDHYWFSEAGVPSFFIYTLGGIKAYHDVFDLRETLPLTKTGEVGKLILEFFNAMDK